MRCLIYARVSKDQRGESRSVTEQENECRTWAAHNGWTIEHVIAETGSASRYAKSTGARSRWTEVTTALAAGNYDALLTWESSRATRDLADYAALRDLCAKHHVRWGYSGTLYDLGDRTDRFRTGLDALMAEDEAARTSERIRRAVRARAAAGQPHGKIPYGYRREYDPTTGALARQLPDETTALIVKEMFTRVADGDTLRAIANDLTDRGIPMPRPARRRDTPAAWMPTTVRRVVENPTHAGHRVHQGQIVADATWPAIVDQDLWDRANAVLADPARRTSPPSRNAKYLLSGIARCGMCGSRLKAMPNRGYLTYQCLQRGCMRVARRTTKVDGYVDQVMLDMLTSDPDRLRDTRDAHPDLQDAKQQLQLLRDRLEAFVEQGATGDLSAATLAKVEARLAPQITAAAARVRSLQPRPHLAGMNFEDPQLSWRGADLAQRRDWIRQSLDIRVMPAGRGNRTFDPALIKITPIW